MSKAPASKSRRKKKGQSSEFNVYYVGLPLLGVGLVFLVVVFFVPKGPGLALVILLAASCLGTGGYLCYQKFFKKRLAFGEDAILVYRCRDNKLIGQIPYSNIATAEIDDHVKIREVTTETDYATASADAEVRERVVAITVFKIKDPDTYWPFKADEDSNEFDFYINAKFSLSLSRIREEINDRVFHAREEKVRQMPARDAHLE